MERKIEEILEPVSAFSRMMEIKLLQNRHKPHWNEYQDHELFELLLLEVDELKYELQKHDRTAESVSLECADIANCAMFIADNYRTGVNHAE